MGNLKHFPHYRQNNTSYCGPTNTGRTAEALRHWEQTSYLLKRQCIVLHNMSENEKVKKICYS